EMLPSTLQSPERHGGSAHEHRRHHHRTRQVPGPRRTCRVYGAASAAQQPRPLRMRAHLPRTGLCGSPLLETEVSGVAGRRAARIRRRGVIMLNVWAASRKAHALVNRLRREHPNATEFEFMEAFYKTVSQDETLQ